MRAGYIALMGRPVGRASFPAACPFVLGWFPISFNFSISQHLEGADWRQRRDDLYALSALADSATKAFKVRMLAAYSTVHASVLLKKFGSFRSFVSIVCYYLFIQEM